MMRTTATGGQQPAQPPRFSKSGKLRRGIGKVLLVAALACGAGAQWYMLADSFERVARSTGNGGATSGDYLPDDWPDDLPFG